jgi:glycerol-3-phosphate acyltransferase PlsX
VRIAVDAMGGDHAPLVNVDGAVAAAREFGIATLLVGGRPSLELLSDAGFSGPEIEIVDAPEVVTMDDPATAPIRRKRNSSIRDRRRTACATAARRGRRLRGPHGRRDGRGQDGHRHDRGRGPAALATVLRTSRATACSWTSARTRTSRLRIQGVRRHGLDLRRARLRQKKPSIGLMSIGEEDSKGTEQTKEVFKTLKATGLNFVGNVEGRDVFNGTVDVIVTDGFTATSF